MKFHCLENSEPITVEFRSWSLTRRVRTFWPGDDMTLGQLHDGLKSLIPFMEEVERAVAQRYHSEALRKIERESGIVSPRVVRATLRLEDECARVEVWPPLCRSLEGIFENAREVLRP
jgi:hypothetical protein